MKDKVYLFDLDGTLISTELLPVIGAELGVFDEINELTKATMAGEVPFDQSFRHRVELLADVPIERVAEIILAQPVHEELMEWVLAKRDSCCVVTGNLDCWVNPWLKKHGLRGFTSTSDITSGRLKVTTVLHKASVLSYFPGFKSIFIGDGANDSEIMRSADISIACSLIHPASQVLLEVADYLVMEESSLCRLLSRL
ncbi:HAD-IB family phosphatase [Methylicorpusculum oleiharenae]|uniref:HAD-IB family phosphatase n=1 Tax=Methylicorpusculum oleiharenae TaxID=1338687 RepID=UPI001357E925|nr:HAD family phosphatase [Methylicorpusculum oleiharenae]MCD2452745.1 HAD-IB family phosphatase [Methylicorpusculum oleiharenae]